MRAAARLLRRWLTRPARTPAWWRMSLAAVLTAVALIGLTSGGTAATVAPDAATAQTGGRPDTSSQSPLKAPEPPGPGDPTTKFPSSPQLVAEGMSLYEDGCSACHGMQLQGVKNSGPSLVGVGPGPVDFYLSTGRMPLQAPQDEPEHADPAYNRHQMDALIAFVTKVGGGPAAPAADPSKGSLSEGLHQFTMNCAGCHQVVGRGGLTIGAFVPNLQHVSPTQIAEAVRMGPYLMPHFDTTQIDQHRLDSIARYILWTRSPDDAGGWGIYNIGPIPEGMVAWFIALLAMVIVARLIGERLGGAPYERR